MENNSRGYANTKATLQWASVEIERLRLLQRGTFVNPQAEPSRLTQLLNSLSNGTFDEERFHIGSRVKSHVATALGEVKQMVEDVESKAGTTRPGEIKRKQTQRPAGERCEKFKESERLSKLTERQGLDLLGHKQKRIFEPSLLKGKYNQPDVKSTRYPPKQNDFNHENAKPNPIFLHSWLVNGLSEKRGLEKAGYNPFACDSPLLHRQTQTLPSPHKVDKNQAVTACQKHRRLLSSRLPQDVSKVRNFSDLVRSEEENGKKDRIRNDGDVMRWRKGKTQNKSERKKVTKNCDGRFLTRDDENQKERKSVFQLRSEQVSTTVYTGSPLKKQVLPGVVIHPDPSLAKSVSNNHAVLNIQHNSMSSGSQKKEDYKNCSPHADAVTTYCEEVVDPGTRRTMGQEDKGTSCADLLDCNIHGSRERKPVTEMQELVFASTGQDWPRRLEDEGQAMVADEDTIRHLHFQDTILQNLEQHLATLATVDQVLADEGAYMIPLKLGDNSSLVDGPREKEECSPDQDDHVEEGSQDNNVPIDDAPAVEQPSSVSSQEQAMRSPSPESHVSVDNVQVQDVTTPVLSSEEEEKERRSSDIPKCETPDASPISSPRHDKNNISTPKFMSPASSPEHKRSKEIDTPPPSPEPPPCDEPNEVTTPVPSLETHPTEVKNTMTKDSAQEPKGDITVISSPSPVISIKHPTTPEVTPPHSPGEPLHSEEANKHHEELQGSSRRDDDDDQQDADSILDVQSSWCSSEIPSVVMHCSSELSQAAPSENSCICVDVSISEGELLVNTSLPSSRKSYRIKERRRKFSGLTSDLSELPLQLTTSKTDKWYLQGQYEPGEMHTGSTDGELSQASENLSTSQSSNNILSVSFDSEKSSKTIGSVIDEHMLIGNNQHLSSEATPDVTRASECGYTSSEKSEVMLQDTSELDQLRCSNERLLARMEGLGSFTLLNRRPDSPS